MGVCTPKCHYVTVSSNFSNLLVDDNTMIVYNIIIMFFAIDYKQVIKSTHICWLTSFTRHNCHRWYYIVYLWCQIILIYNIIFLYSAHRWINQSSLIMMGNPTSKSNHCTVIFSHKKWIHVVISILAKIGKCNPSACVWRLANIFFLELEWDKRKSNNVAIYIYINIMHMLYHFYGCKRKSGIMTKCWIKRGTLCCDVCLYWIQTFTTSY